MKLEETIDRLYLESMPRRELYALWGSTTTEYESRLDAIARRAFAAGREASATTKIKEESKTKK